MAGSSGIAHVPGRLRLKTVGSSTATGGVGVDKAARLKSKKKSKKKKKDKQEDQPDLEDAGVKEKDDSRAGDGVKDHDNEGIVHDSQEPIEGHHSNDDRGAGADKIDSELSTKGKTDAEIRFEERKRKRLDDLLKKEGVKTHMERVQELNRYLSRLSEHHDMPRIGPG